MADAPTLAPPPVGDAVDRTIRPRRGLPSGRAVVGAFLVVLAAVGTFWAYLSATAAPDTSYLVATRGFDIGHVVTEEDLVGTESGFRGTAIDLPAEQAARAVRSTGGDAQALVGRVVVAPIAAGDLLQRTQFVDAATGGGGVFLSFSLPVDRALAGRVAPGERVDVLATVARPGESGSQTGIVARDVVVVTATRGGEGLNGGRVLLTVEVPDLATAQALQHAVDTAQVAVLRGGDASATTPPATSSSADAIGGAEQDG